MAETTPPLRGTLIKALLASWSVADDPISRTMARVAAGRNVDTILAALAIDTGEIARLRNRVTALEANGAELLARAEHAEDAAQLHGERSGRWRRERDAARRERDEAREERDNHQDRLRKSESAYTRLDAGKRDAEAARDRWKARAEEAEAERDAFKVAIAEVRRLQELTIAASCRVQAIDQAVDTLAVLDRALAATEATTEETNDER